MSAPSRLPESIPAPLIADALKGAFRAQREAEGASAPPLGWVLSVPDTHQRTLIAHLERDPDVRMLTCSTEDEANAIAAGLYVGGAAGGAPHPARGAVRLGEHAAGRRDGRWSPDLRPRRPAQP